MLLSAKTLRGNKYVQSPSSKNICNFVTLSRPTICTALLFLIGLSHNWLQFHPVIHRQQLQQEFLYSSSYAWRFSQGPRGASTFWQENLRQQNNIQSHFINIYIYHTSTWEFPTVGRDMQLKILHRMDGMIAMQTVWMKKDLMFNTRFVRYR